jgi:hypothetical protein
MSPLEQEYAALESQAADAYESERRTVAREKKVRWDRIHNMTQRVLAFEDRYRLIGAKYYRRGWLVNMEEETDTGNGVSKLIVDALHGDGEEDRAFFQPWRDLDAALQRAVGLMTSGKLEEASRELEDASNLANQVRAALDKLDHYVGIANHTYSLIREDPAGADMLQNRLPSRDMAM